MNRVADVKERGVPARTPPKTPATVAQWTFLTNHAHVLICLAGNPRVLVRELARQVGITERAVMTIISDLEEAGVVVRERDGRANHYHVKPERPLRHPVEAHRRVRDLLAMVLGEAALRRTQR